jgi:hypothetical protein
LWTFFREYFISYAAVGVVLFACVAVSKVGLRAMVRGIKPSSSCWSLRPF